MPDKEQLDYLHDLKVSYGYALQADRLARSLLTACQVPESAFREDSDGSGDDEAPSASLHPFEAESSAVTLSSYTSAWGYYSYRILPEYGNMMIGGVGRLLRRSVREISIEWLLACDRTLCHVHDEEMTPPPQGLTALIESLAKDIAKRLTLHHKALDVVPMEV